MFTIRPMTAADFEAVIALDVRAFTDYAQRTEPGAALQPRTREHVAACHALNPDGCFVALENAALVGFIFSRHWGALGWVGVFGVEPTRAGQGVGKVLLTAAVDSLWRAGCTSIGLETMPDSPENVGLYTRFGFWPTYPTLTLQMPTHDPDLNVPFSRLSQSAGDGALMALAKISSAAWPGLDYSADAENARDYGWGETLLIGLRQPWAVAIVRTAPRREGMAAPMAELHALVLRPQHRRRLHGALQAIERFAHDLRVPYLTVNVNAIDSESLQMMIKYGFRVTQTRLRMLLRQDYQRPAGIDLSRWSM